DPHIELVNIESVADPAFGLADFLAECLSGPADEQEHEAKMDDVPAIAACVAHRQVDDGFVEPFTRTVCSCLCALVELADDRDADKDAHHEGKPRIEVIDAEKIEWNTRSEG